MSRTQGFFDEFLDGLGGVMQTYGAGLWAQQGGYNNPQTAMGYSPYGQFQYPYQQPYQQPYQYGSPYAPPLPMPGFLQNQQYLQQQMQAPAAGQQFMPLMGSGSAATTAPNPMSPMTLGLGPAVRTVGAPNSGATSTGGGGYAVATRIGATRSNALATYRDGIIVFEPQW